MGALRGWKLDRIDDVEWLSLILNDRPHNLVPVLVIDLFHAVKCERFPSSKGLFPLRNKIFLELRD